MAGSEDEGCRTAILPEAPAILGMSSYGNDGRMTPLLHAPQTRPTWWSHAETGAFVRSCIDHRWLSIDDYRIQRRVCTDPADRLEVVIPDSGGSLVVIGHVSNASSVRTAAGAPPTATDPRERHVYTVPKTRNTSGTIGAMNLVPAQISGQRQLPAITTATIQAGASAARRPRAMPIRKGTRMRSANGQR